MSIQLASTDVIQVLLDAAPATNQLPVNVSYVDQGGSGNNLPSITSGTTPVTIVGSPASGVERLVSHISIPNADTATRTVTVNLVRSSAASRLCKITLQAGYALYYDGKWMVLDPNGNFLCDVTVTGGTLTSNQGSPAAIANAWPVEVTDGTNVLGTSAHPIRTDPTGTTTQPVSGTVNAVQSGTWNVNATQAGSWSVGILSLPSIPVGTNTIGNVNAIQSGTWTVQQGGSNWSQNVSQWGGTATTLGQKVSTSSVPVVIASDQPYFPVRGITSGVSAIIVTGTTPQNITGTSNTNITAVTISVIGAVLAAGNVNLSVTDGSGTLRIFMTIPVATATAVNPYLLCDFQDLFVPLVNNGISANVKLSANLTSGSILFGYGLTG